MKAMRYVMVLIALMVSVNIVAKPKIRIIATGGTIEAACQLVEELGGEVAKIVFLMELAGLNGREKLAKYDVESVVTYEGK